MADHHDKWTKTVLDLDPQAVKALHDRLPAQVDAYLELWLTASTDAMTEMPQTSDTTQAHNFGLALLGNLAWAATCLVPEAKMIVIAASFGGATIGSGTFSGSDPYPIKEIHDQLYGARDQVSKKFRASAGTIAVKLIKDGCATQEAQDQGLWQAVFNGVPFDDKSALLGRARAAISRAFAQFTGLYDRWLTETYAEGQKKAGPMPPPGDQGGAILIWTQHCRDRTDEIRKQKPFKANFAL